MISPSVELESITRERGLVEEVLGFLRRTEKLEYGEGDVLEKREEGEENNKITEELQRAVVFMAIALRRRRLNE